ncbi:MAG TPA: hypothetical protein VFV38_24815 [Ktedonobacteraceae bacterium]|nr:hypothetical protein [Ktedonobacteraceae bacterium]
MERHLPDGNWTGVSLRSMELKHENGEVFALLSQHTCFTSICDRFVIVSDEQADHCVVCSS